LGELGGDTKSVSITIKSTALFPSMLLGVRGATILLLGLYRLFGESGTELEESSAKNRIFALRAAAVMATLLPDVLRVWEEGEVRK
jgi:hypothetical protein